MRTIPRILTLFLLGFLIAGASLAATAEPRTPHEILDKLSEKMYTIGETSGEFAEMEAAEQDAAAEIAALVADKVRPDTFTQRNKAGDTPLIYAAFYGFHNVVIELLKSDAVKKTIDDKDAKGGSAWVYANMAMLQSKWVCNPEVLDAPFALVPLLVVQPYYTESIVNRYKVTRLLLAQAGAAADIDQAKAFWQDFCKLQTVAMREKVDASRDLIVTVTEEGTASLIAFLAALQAKEPAR